MKQHTDYKSIKEILKFNLKMGYVKSISLVIASNSMQPFLHRGDEVIVCYKKDYNVGDVIAYTHSSTSITIHRIVCIKEDLIQTKGDNNVFLDPYTITQNDVIGVVYRRE